MNKDELNTEAYILQHDVEILESIVDDLSTYTEHRLKKLRKLKESLKQMLSATAISPTNIYAFVVGTDKAEWFRHWNGTAWSAWASKGVNLN